MRGARVSSTIANLDAEQAKLQERRKKINIERQHIEQRLSAIEREKHRLTLVDAVGQQVRIRYRQPAGDRCAKLNDATGTLLKINRTLARVDFGEHGIWRWQIDELLLAGDAERQGFVFMLGRAAQ
jgi:hypothetical protein